MLIKAKIDAYQGKKTKEEKMNELAIMFQFSPSFTAVFESDKTVPVVFFLLHYLFLFYSEIRGENDKLVLKKQHLQNKLLEIESV